MLEFQQDNQFFLFNLTEKPTEPASFFESAFWEKQQRIIGSAKGRGTTYFLNTKDLFGVNTALRHYYRGGLWGKFNKDRYRLQSFTETRSVAEFQLLNQLHQAGVAVPKPIAARVKKGKLGICYQADILIEKIENAQDLTALLQTQQLPNDVWQAIGKLICKFAIRISMLTIFSFNNSKMNKNVGSLISISAVKNQAIFGNKAT